MENIKNSKKRVLYITLILGCIVLIGIGVGLAKYITTVNGNGSATVAKPICALIVSEYKCENNEINPYCDVEVNNYNSDGEVSEVAMNFDVEVNDENGKQLTNYYWKDEQGNDLGKDLTGSFDTTNKEQKKYKIYFINTNGIEKTERVNFVINATQKIN